MSDFDDEPRGRSATGAVIIAVIFLAILGTGVGLVLGSQSRNNDTGNEAAGDSTATATATPSAAPTPGNTAGSKPTNTRTPTRGASYRPTARDKCPQQTEEAAGTSLSVKRFVRTNRSEVWICAGGGKTVYQGHVIGSPFTGATSDSTLFIGSVAVEGDVFTAANGETRYIVGKETLRIEKNGSVLSDEEVIDLYQG
jgi:hypothetical protein